MANTCLFEMRVKGSVESKQRLVELMEDNRDAKQYIARTGISYHDMDEQTNDSTLLILANMHGVFILV